MLYSTHTSVLVTSSFDYYIYFLITGKGDHSLRLTFRFPIKVRMKLASGHTYEEVEAKEKERFRKLMQGRNTDMIVLQPGGWAVPRNYLKFQDKVYNFKVSSAFLSKSCCHVTARTFTIWIK